MTGMVYLIAQAMPEKPARPLTEPIMRCSDVAWLAYCEAVWKARVAGNANHSVDGQVAYLKQVMSQGDVS